MKWFRFEIYFINTAEFVYLYIDLPQTHFVKLTCQSSIFKNHSRFPCVPFESTFMSKRSGGSYPYLTAFRIKRNWLFLFLPQFKRAKSIVSFGEIKKKAHLINKNRHSRFDISKIMPYLVKIEGHYCFPLVIKTNQTSTYPLKLSILKKDGKSFQGTCNNIYQN